MTDSDWPDFVAFARKHFGMSHNSNLQFNRHWFRCRGVAPEQEQGLDGWTGLVLEDEGSIVGVMMFISVSARFEGRSLPMAWISTGVVEEDARGIGGGAQMYLWIYKNFPIVGALSGNELSRPINALMGHEIPNLSMRRFLSVHHPDVKQLLPEGVSADIADKITARTVAGDLSWEWRDELPSEFGDLWTRFRDIVSVTTNRSPEHYAWRISSAPYMDYRFLEIRRRNQLIGLSVVRFQNTPAGAACRVIDFIAPPEDALHCWSVTATACADAGGLFSDFHVVGTVFDEALIAGGFQLPEKDPVLDAVPNLLSPVDHRKWTNTFHLGGSDARGSEKWRTQDQVYFTKADSDRDWPTQYELDRLGIVDREGEQFC